MPWVARCDSLFLKQDLSPRFDNARDCQEYIDKNLKVMEFLITHLFICLHFHGYKNNKLDNDYPLFKNNYIRCYNTTQKRFATSFDF